MKPTSETYRANHENQLIYSLISDWHKDASVSVWLLNWTVQGCYQDNFLLAAPEIFLMNITVPWHTQTYLYLCRFLFFLLFCNIVLLSYLPLVLLRFLIRTAHWQLILLEKRDLPGPPGGPQELLIFSFCLYKEWFQHD